MVEVDLLGALGFGPAPMRAVWGVAQIVHHLWGDEHGRRLLWDHDDHRLVVMAKRGVIMAETAKQPLRCLTRHLPGKGEGKYLVKRRDGTVPPWPSFVLGGADPVAEVALRAYAAECRRLLRDEPAQAERLGLTREFVDDLFRFAGEFARWRLQHGQGDPGMGPHRIDDPATIAEMRQGYGA